MAEFMQNSAYAGVTISLISYAIGAKLKRKFGFGFLNPLLISIIVTIIVLVGCNVSYETYNEGAKYLSWLLTPATVCLAIPLYEEWELLKNNAKAVLLGVLAGVITSLVTVFVLSKMMGLSHANYVTLLPKSITTAIGMGVSEELGGYVTITVAVIVITGVLGNILKKRKSSSFKFVKRATAQHLSPLSFLHNISITQEASIVLTIKGGERGIFRLTSYVANSENRIAREEAAKTIFF